MRVIPIVKAAVDVAAESAAHAAAMSANGGGNEAEGQVPRLDLPLVRREFLKGSGILIGTIATGSVLAALAPSPVWAVELKTLSQSEGQTLMAMGRVFSRQSLVRSRRRSIHQRPACRRSQRHPWPALGRQYRSLPVYATTA